ncbi:hypothetical protein [Massilia sp.]|uniref:hypothetical protein n=1 Tax=Massilia sp. TaxID=1882437 RepID=UPI00289E2F7E|nr:hypothetical protein [Massilia sp.]
MSAALKDYWLLWRMALSTRHPRASMIVLGLTTLGTVLVGALAQMKEGDLVLTAGLALRVALGGVLGGWMLYFVPGAVKLNSPFAARLVPRLRRRLIALTMLVWATAVGAATLMSLDTRLSPALVFLGTGTWLAAYGLGQSGHRAGAWVQFGTWMLIVFHDRLPPGLVEQVKSGSGFAVAILLMLAFGAFALQAMYMDGGERHYAAREAQKLQIERLSTDGQFRERKQHKLGASIYARALRRDCEARDVGKLLGHLLGSANHWLNRAISLAVVVGLVAIAVGGFRLFGSAETNDMITAIGWLFALPLLLMPLFGSELRAVRLKDTAAEQALFRLVPPMPAGAPDFNRKLSGTLMRIALAEWGILAGAVLGLGMITGASAANLFMQICICCLSLPLVAANLRDHARRSGLQGWRLLCGFALSLGISFGLAAAAQRAIGLPVTAGAALVSIAIAIALVVRGFRRADTAPYAFPAGRLA